MAITRIQATPKVVLGSSSTTISVTFATPPSLGNSVVLVVTSNGPGAAIGCTDNHGHPYTRAASRAKGATGPAVDVFVTSAITATGAAFTVTSTTPPAALMAIALELGGPVTVDQIAATDGGAATLTVGPTAALTASTVLMLAAVSTSSTINTVETVTPAWLEEADQAARGEVDSRLRTGAAGTTQTVTWALNGANNYAAVLVAFAAGAAPPPPGDGVHLLVNGIDRPVRRGTLRLTRRVNIRPTLEVEVFSRDGSYQPAEGDAVVLIEDGVTLYGGRIQHPSTEGVDQLPIPASSTRIDCVDLQALADELYLTTTFPGGTVKDFLEWVVAGYLAAKGTTVDPAQVAGPALPAVAFTYRSLKRVSDGLTDACQLAIGWSWTISPSNVLTAQPPTAVNAPFNINPSNRQAIGDVRVEVTSELYANRIIVLGSEQVILQYKDEFTTLTDGVRTVFPLALRATGDSAPKPNAGVVWVVADDSSEVAETFGSPSDVWEFDAATNTVIDHGPPAGYRPYPLPLGRAAWIIYDGIPTAIGMAEDIAAQATRGVVEHVLTSTVQDAPTLDAIAAAELVKALALPLTVTYETDGLGLAPGQLQAIDVPERGVSGTFVLQQVETRDVFAQNPDGTPRLRHQVTAVEYVLGATVYPGTVGDLYTQWAGDGGAGGAAPSISAPPSVSGLTGDVTATGPGTVPATIAADAVTYAKMQNISAASRLLGRGSAAGAGDPQELTLGAHLSLTGTVLAADIDGGLPAAHAPTHSNGGTDPVTITNLAGYPGGTTTFLRADHTFAAPAGGGGATHYDAPLSDGDLTAADLIYAAGECVIVQVPA